jgi:hypothetical protein
VEKQKMKKFFSILFVYIFPLLCVVVWTSYPSIQTYLTVLEIRKQDFVGNASHEPTYVRRKIQQFFLKSGTRITMDDIIYARSLDVEDDDGLMLLQKACGKSNIYVWVPFRFRLPLYGDKIIQSCVVF